ncbi:conserved hypothetical protein [Trichinella spiralis]|uniref:hypothetical protein n=1 Tax=Trichinella spiralis TaxID=6334 RepID=UPI0001EFBF58|nr:conserved hypothetical protein [Trichinella spiralis]
MLLATASLKLHVSPAAVELLGRCAMCLIATLFKAWRVKMNRLAAQRHRCLYERLQLLIDEQGSTETLNSQLRITVLTTEYDGGRRTMEQFLIAVAYLVSKEENN